MNRILIIVCALLSSGTAVGQSDRRPPPKVFHIQGTIFDPTDAVIPNVEVHLVGENTSQSESTDDNGVFHADLPVGDYTMTVNPSGPDHRIGFTGFRRFFRVLSPMTITLDGVLSATVSCDPVVIGPDPSAEEAVKDLCGGEDSVSVRSRDGVPFRLDIQYSHRERKEHSTIYTRGRSTASGGPVLVAYNLFLLRADSVDYDEAEGVLTASGSVIMEDQSGQIRASSAKFRFDDGEAIRVR